MRISKNKSFDYWSLWEFFKGRKKTAITIVGVIIGYVISNNETVAVASGAVVEGIFAVADYYYKEIRLK